MGVFRYHLIFSFFPAVILCGFVYGDICAGDPAGEIVLPKVGGGIFRLDEISDTSVMLVFGKVDCAYCRGKV